MGNIWSRGWLLRLQLYSHTQKDSQKSVEFPMCYHYAFNHLKAQPNSNGKIMSDFWFSYHPNVYHCAFNHFKSTAKFKWEYNVRYLVYLYNILMCYHQQGFVKTLDGRPKSSSRKIQTPVGGAAQPIVDITLKIWRLKCRNSTYIIEDLFVYVENWLPWWHNPVVEISPSK